MKVQLVWGCNPARQLEVAWIRWLIGDALVTELPWWNSLATPASLEPGLVPVLVESGLLHLERSPSPARLSEQMRARSNRLATLRQHGSFGILHLSDEEGYDADSFYQELSPELPVWRNFCHPRLDRFPQVRTFPIGPRGAFLALRSSDFALASQRSFPWAFMGTLWPSGSRRAAVSLFLRSLPTGFYFGGQRFGQGLPLADYRNNLMNSIFALAPEGDRHLETFRLWESLSCGCIPLMVDHRSTADRLLHAPHPLPVFDRWSEALVFAQAQLSDPAGLDKLQVRIYSWWLQYRRMLALAWRDSLIRFS